MFNYLKPFCWIIRTETHIQFPLPCSSWPTGGAMALPVDPVDSIIHHIRLGLFELCWNILPHWLWFSSYIRICSYVRICSDFSVEDGKIIHTVCQTVTQHCCCCASLQFVMQPLAAKLIHNTNSPVTRVVVSVFAGWKWGHGVRVSNSMFTTLLS